MNGNSFALFDCLWGRNYVILIRKVNKYIKVIALRCWFYVSWKWLIHSNVLLTSKQFSGRYVFGDWYLQISQNYNCTITIGTSTAPTIINKVLTCSSSSAMMTSSYKLNIFRVEHVENIQSILAPLDFCTSVFLTLTFDLMLRIWCFMAHRLYFSYEWKAL